MGFLYLHFSCGEIDIKIIIIGSSHQDTESFNLTIFW